MKECTCKGTKLLPLIKNGKVIPNAFVHCQCYEEESTNPITPADYDFPMSDTFREYSYRYCGVPDPRYIPPQDNLEERLDSLEERISNTVPPSRTELQQVKGQLNYLFLKQKEYEANRLKKRADII